ncbi:carbon storage regulator CsrA [Hathewaya histolytica]|uniref:Translational regulator CsrA n=1 Tax=Hathewaya histolytica TaxID=1498 RepID=A0A4U9RBJ3_HATHI|nr:carbon storage regulator CsrA [Hathewaya histolytica]VTQ87613.1 carbon storage regulator CsrA [Hathewaya histolytica]
MLVIKRKQGQSIMIGEDIQITVISSEGGSVKLGINAPKELSVLREELIEEVKYENENAINIDIEALKNISFLKEK